MIILAINKETGKGVLIKCNSVLPFLHKGCAGKVACQGEAYTISRKIRKDVGEGNLKNPCWMN